MMEVRPISLARTLLQWYEEQAKIDMDPSYQRRGDLWPDKNKKLLINSILNQYDIPKIYLADFTYGSTELDENRKPYAVIDGKQRLNIFFAFFEDKIPLDNTTIYQNGDEVALGGYRYSDLKETYPFLAKQFENFIPTVMSVIADRYEEIQELFIRLNTNVSISGPERRNALPGPLPHLIRDLSVHNFFRTYATFPINRGQDLNAAAKILLMEYRGGLTNTKKADLDRFVTTNEEKDPSDFDEVCRNAVETLDKMTNVFQENDSLLKGQAQLPVYYWFVRTFADDFAGIIRDFLRQFQQARTDARILANARATNENLPLPDSALLEYYSLIRSPDDRRSQLRMFSTLEERFLSYLHSLRQDPMPV